MLYHSPLSLLHYSPLLSSSTIKSMFYLYVYVYTYICVCIDDNACVYIWI
jgi:hypothetical protein